MIIHPLSWFRRLDAWKRRRAPKVRIRLSGFTRWIDGQFISDDGWPGEAA